MLRSNSKHYYFLRLGLLANRAIDKRSLLIQAYYTGNYKVRALIIKSFSIHL